MMESLTAELNRNPVDYSTFPKENSVLNQTLRDNLPEIRERFILKLLQGNIEGIDDIKSQARQLQIPDEGRKYCVCMMSTAEGFCAIDTDTALCLLRKRIKEIAAQSDLHIFCCIDLQNRLCCTISSSENEDPSVIENGLTETICKTAQETGVELFYGLGPVVDRLELLSESSNLAKSLLERSMTLNITGGNEKGDIHYYNSTDIHERLLGLFREGDISGIINAVNSHVALIRLDIPGRQVLIERFVVLYLQNITNECMRLGVTLERFESYVPAVVALMQLDSVGSVDAVLQLTEQILKYISVHRTTESNHLLNMAKDYILENIGNERLDLAAVSDHVGLSRVYFCKLFHQMEGVNFSAYLKKVRIEKAKQLLLTTNMKVFEVSNAVGFSHAKYFGRVFKEAVGQTPVEFQRGIHTDA